MFSLMAFIVAFDRGLANIAIIPRMMAKKVKTPERLIGMPLIDRETNAPEKALMSNAKKIAVRGRIIEAKRTSKPITSPNIARLRFKLITITAPKVKMKPANRISGNRDFIFFVWCKDSSVNFAHRVD